MSNLLCEAKGIGGQLFVFDDKVVISRKGFLGAVGHGFAGDKEIRINQISSVQFKKAGPMFNGFIQFAFLGGKEAKRGVFEAAQDENTVMFNVWQQEQFEKAKSAIDERINAYQTTPQVAASNENDIPSQIKKLAELKESGILTEEEFNAKKTELLAKM